MITIPPSIAVTIALAGIGWIIKIRLSSIKERKNTYEKHLIPIISLKKQIVISAFNDVFSVESAQKLGSMISDILPFIKKEILINNYAKEFMENLIFLVDVKNKEKVGMDFDFEKMRKIRGWFFKQQPKDINDIYSTYLKWWK